MLSLTWESGFSFHSLDRLESYVVVVSRRGQSLGGRVVRTVASSRLLRLLVVSGPYLHRVPRADMVGSVRSTLVSGFRTVIDLGSIVTNRYYGTLLTQEHKAVRAARGLRVGASGWAAFIVGVAGALAGLGAIVSKKWHSRIVFSVLFLIILGMFIAILGGIHSPGSSNSSGSGGSASPSTCFHWFFMHFSRRKRDPMP